jgi:hypothetical protein
MTHDSIPPDYRALAEQAARLGFQFATEQVAQMHTQMASIEPLLATYRRAPLDPTQDVVDPACGDRWLAAGRDAR